MHCISLSIVRTLLAFGGYQGYCCFLAIYQCSSITIQGLFLLQLQIYDKTDEICLECWENSLYSFIVEACCYKMVTQQQNKSAVSITGQCMPKHFSV